MTGFLPYRYLAVGLLSFVLVTGSFAASPDRAIPQFAPNPAVGWVAFAPAWIAPGKGPGPVADDPAHPRIGNDEFRAQGAQPSFPTPDLSSPILQPWVREQLRKRRDLILSGKPAFPNRASCYPAGVPQFDLYPVQPIYFVQSPNEVLIIWQADHQVRHVYIGAQHSDHVKPSWYGDSVGHYEGDTLVVDTIGLDTRTSVDNFETPHSPQLHVIERFHMVQNGDVLEVDVRVEDPGAFTTPWNAIQRYHRSEPGRAENREAFNPVSSSDAAGPMLESSCAENNDLSFFGPGVLPIPQTIKADF
ncbi:MAG TPA: hypothetical protein VFW28_06115 [Micropepsaceae bacterium]|nr:hypothetical protein [Micropepsaceae bacterium]